MASSPLVHRYADALLASPDACATASLDALKALAAAVRTHDSLSRILANRAIPRVQRLAVLLSLAEKQKAPSVVLRFLGVLADNNRLALLVPVVEAVIEKHRQKTEGDHIVVAVPVLPDTDAARNDLVARARALTGAKGGQVSLVANPALLGGMQVRIGSMLHDHSVSGKLERLRAHLLAA
jgi:F-type H+-transporting ATPase subunit delta